MSSPFDPVATLFERVNACGIPMVRICRKAGIDETTPSRWKRGKNGANLNHVLRLHAALDELLLAGAA